MTPESKEQEPWWRWHVCWRDNSEIVHAHRIPTLIAQAESRLIDRAIARIEAVRPKVGDELNVDTRGRYIGLEQATLILKSMVKE